MKRALLIALLACSTSSGCEGGFASPSRVDSLRVFGVKSRVRMAEESDFSDVASGSPGARVRLELLAVDASTKGSDSAPRPLQTAWFGGCHNPPRRQFYDCYPWLRAGAAELDPSLVSERNRSAPSEYFRATANAELSVRSEDAGTAFEFTLPDDILSAAPRYDRDTVHFGVSFVFFAVCAGLLEARPELTGELPVRCVDPTSRAELGAKDFVTGFTTVYSYDGVQNQNPKLERLTLGGVDVDGVCSTDDECALPEGAEAGLSRRCNESGRCVLTVPRCVGQKCSKFLIVPAISSDSGERVPGGDQEIIWANFYANGGYIGVHAELLNDRALGRIAEPGSFFTPPRAMRPSVDLWVTVDDQRGGTDFRQFSVEVSE